MNIILQRLLEVVVYNFLFVTATVVKKVCNPNTAAFQNLPMFICAFIDVLT